MRVLFVNRYFHPDQSATSRLLTDLALVLSADGVEVHVVTSTHRIDDPQAALPARETVEGVQVHRIGGTRFGRGRLVLRALDYLTFHLAARRRVGALASSGDVVVAKTDPPLLSVSLAGVVRRRDAVLVTWLQDCFPEVAEALGVVRPDGLVARTLRRLRDRSLAGAAATVVLGDAMARVVARRGIPAERIRVISNWADGERIGPRGDGAARLRAEWGLAEDHFLVGYCGNLGRVHEFDTVLDAAARLAGRADVRFVFVGDGAQRGTLEAGVARRGLGSVVVRPPQSEAVLPDMLAMMDAHVVCLAPALEGLVVPSKIHGALAAGRPVINVGAPDAELSTMVEEAGCGVGIAVGDDTAMASAITTLADDRPRCERMGDAARSLFERRFSREQAHRAWQALLAEVADRG